MLTFVEKHGFRVIRETPLYIQWIDETKKQAFYASVFSKEEQQLHQFLSRRCFSGNEDIYWDYVLYEENIALMYWKDQHDELVSLVEQLDPERFRSIRLPLVTGSYLAWDGLFTNYTHEIRHLLHDFLKQGQQLLRNKMEQAINRLFETN